MEMFLSTPFGAIQTLQDISFYSTSQMKHLIYLAIIIVMEILKVYHHV